MIDRPFQAITRSGDLFRKAAHMIEISEARKVAQMLSAVGETTRMLILHRLIDGPLHVGELANLVGIPMVNMSHHLGVMRVAGILDHTKEGRKVLYSFRPEVFTPGDGKGTIGCLKIGNYTLSLSKPPEEKVVTKKRAKK